MGNASDAQRRDGGDPLILRNVLSSGSSYFLSTALGYDCRRPWPPYRPASTPAVDERPGVDIAVRLERVSKRFGARMVLDDVTFAVPRSRAFCILGRSGTGKSVTLRHIIGLVTPDAGQVFVEGQDITALGSRALADVRRRMGFLFQAVRSSIP